MKYYEIGLNRAMNLECHTIAEQNDGCQKRWLDTVANLSEEGERSWTTSWRVAARNGKNKGLNSKLPSKFHDKNCFFQPCQVHATYSLSRLRLCSCTQNTWTPVRPSAGKWCIVLNWYLLLAWTSDAALFDGGRVRLHGAMQSGMYVSYDILWHCGKV